MNSKPTRLQINMEKVYEVVLQSKRHIHIVIVGAGGTGSYAVEQAISVASHMRTTTTRVTVQIMDRDIVKPHNVGRSNFIIGDSGKFKVMALRDRLASEGELLVTPQFLTGHTYRCVGWPGPVEGYYGTRTIVVGCVDNPFGRNAIANYCAHVRNRGQEVWWVDSGNDQWSGQVALGNTFRKWKYTEKMKMVDALPFPSVQLPQLLEVGDGDEDPAEQDEGCEVNMVSGAQSLFVNRMAAVTIGQVLYDLIVSRRINYHRIDFNTRPVTAVTRRNTKSILDKVSHNR